MAEYTFPTAFTLLEAQERAAIARVTASERFTMGPEVAAFETDLAAFHQRKHAVMVNSGSSANLLAVAALTLKADAPLQRGDLALVPALAWGTTYAPLVQYGMDLTLADIDATWNAPAAYTSAVSIVPRRRDPRLVVACSVLGNPAYLEEWARVADALGAYLIEDNCESISAVTPDGRMTGRFGIASTLSFYWSHQVNALEGGAVLTDDDEMALLCRMLRDHGLTRTTQDKLVALGVSVPFANEYDFRFFGYNLRPMEMSAAVGRAQLPKLPTHQKLRNANLAYFTRLAAEADLPITLPALRGAPSPFGLAFTLDDPTRRPRLAAALRARGIDCRPPTGGSFTRHPYGAPWRDANPTPVADRVHDAGLFLGCAPYPIEDLIERAVLVMQEVL